MLEFFKEQIRKVEDELKGLYAERSNAGIETEGGYDNIIARKKRELDKLSKELEELKSESINGSQSEESLGSKSTKLSQKQKDEITSLIQRAELEKAINRLLQIVQKSVIIQLSGRFHKLKQQNLTGVISSSEYHSSTNKITLDLLNILNDL